MDDEEAIRELVEFTLTRLGYEVCGAETALRGIELYREALDRGRRFDLVILDLTLPGGMGGKEALKRADRDRSESECDRLQRLCDGRDHEAL